MGPIESETWQPEKVIPNKINTAHTYLANTNYWAPLHEAEEDDSTDQTNTIPTAHTIKTQNQTNGHVE